MGVIQGAKKTNRGLWTLWSMGNDTKRAAWVYNYSRKTLIKNVSACLTLYANEVCRVHAGLVRTPREFTNDLKSISWSRALYRKALSGQILPFDDDRICIATYRPFAKHYHYFDSSLNDMMSKLPTIFPLKEPGKPWHNKVIVLT
jgi:predicted helicase